MSSIERISVVALLTLHAGLISRIAATNAPMFDEVAHLPVGLIHWQTSTFDLYRVNPPLMRMICAIPLLLLPHDVDLGYLSDDPYARPEFNIGSRFIYINGYRSVWLFMVCRLMQIPIMVFGGWLCYQWSSEMFGRVSGLIALTLWSFCPNLLSWGASITPDAGAAVFGMFAGYCFWQWLRRPDVVNLLLAGGSLGMAELTKSTWVILFGLWPALASLWEIAQTGNENRSAPGLERVGRLGLRKRWAQLVAVMGFGVLIVNMGYAFEGSFRSLDQFRFISQALGGIDAHTNPGNRFVGTWLGRVPIPLPANFILGIDVQRYDFEVGKWSYLLGEQKLGGWWYYYIFAIGVKTPAGTLLLISLAILHAASRISSRWVTKSIDQVIILAPAIAVFVLVSSQTGFNRYLRYVLPIYPLLFIWASQVGQSFAPMNRGGGSFSTLHHYNQLPLAAKLTARLRTVFRLTVVMSLLSSAVSSVMVWPYSLSYFNELAGGPMSGPKYLLDANVDWGQDLLSFQEWAEAHPDLRPLYLNYFGIVDPKSIGIDCPKTPDLSQSDDLRASNRALYNSLPGWHAISINGLYGYKHNGNETDRFAFLRQETPVARCGYSILIFHLTPADVDRLRRPKAISSD